MNLRILSAASVLAMGLLVSPAGAAPVSTDVGAAAKSSASASVEQVQYRGRAFGGGVWRGRPWGGAGWRGPGRWLGIGAGIAAGALVYNYAYRPRVGYYYDTYDYNGPYYYPADYQGDPREICARNFKSFEWRTGLYTTYHGEKKLCPYLREY